MLTSTMIHTMTVRMKSSFNAFPKKAIMKRGYNSKDDVPHRSPSPGCSLTLPSPKEIAPLFSGRTTLKSGVSVIQKYRPVM